MHEKGVLGLLPSSGLFFKRVNLQTRRNSSQFFPVTRHTKQTVTGYSTLFVYDHTMCIPGNAHERGPGSHRLRRASTIRFRLVWVQNPDLRLLTAATTKETYNGNSKPDKKKYFELVDIINSIVFLPSREDYIQH